MIFIDDSSEKVTETVPGHDILQLLIFLIESVLIRSSGIFMLLVRKLQKAVLRVTVGSLLFGSSNWGTGENIKVLLAVLKLSRVSCCSTSARTGLLAGFGSSCCTGIFTSCWGGVQVYILLLGGASGTNERGAGTELRVGFAEFPAQVIHLLL